MIIHSFELFKEFCSQILGGKLKFPWKPVVKPFEGEVTYTLDSDGLIIQQKENWSISAFEALRETFTPGFTA